MDFYEKIITELTEKQPFSDGNHKSTDL